MGPDFKDITFLGEDNFPAPYVIGGEEPTEHEKQNIRVIERIMEEFWCKAQVEKGCEFFAPECWRYDPVVPDLLGPDAYGAVVKKYHEAFAMEDFDLQIVMADKDWIAWRTKSRAKHVGEFEGIPASGADLAIITHTFVRFNEQHLVQEGWILTDYLSLFIKIFFALSTFQRIWYLPRFYKALKRIRKNIDAAPTNPTGSGTRQFVVGATK